MCRDHHRRRKPNDTTVHKLGAIVGLLVVGAAAWAVARRDAMMPDTKDLEVSPDGKSLYAIGPMAKQVAVFAIGMDRLPHELPAGQSPYKVTSGQWTTGLVVQ
jgi:hypothetical protein